MGNPTDRRCTRCRGQLFVWDEFEGPYLVKQAGCLLCGETFELPSRERTVRAGQPIPRVAARQLR